MTTPAKLVEQETPPDRPWPAAAPAAARVEIVIPVRDEERDIELSVRRLQAYLTAWFPFSTHITIAITILSGTGTQLGQDVPGFGTAGISEWGLPPGPGPGLGQPGPAGRRGDSSGSASAHPAGHAQSQAPLARWCLR